MSGSDPTPAHLQYQALMTNVRARYEVIEALNLNPNSAFAELETTAFHLRKSIEGIAFGCLVALDEGLKNVPRDARGQWNADNIFARLSKREKLVFPESFLRTDPTTDNPGVQHVMAAHEDVNLSIDDVREIYRRSHKWLHEWNPYIEKLGKEFPKSRDELLRDVPRIWNWIVQHRIGIGGHMFLGILKDPRDGQLRVVAARAMN